MGIPYLITCLICSMNQYIKRNKQGFLECHKCRSITQTCPCIHIICPVCFSKIVVARAYRSFQCSGCMSIINTVEIIRASKTNVFHANNINEVPCIINTQIDTTNSCNRLPYEQSSSQTTSSPFSLGGVVEDLNIFDYSVYSPLILEPYEVDEHILKTLMLKRNPNRMNPYMFFSYIHSLRLKKEFPSSPFTDIGSLMGKIWRGMTTELREQWTVKMNEWLSHIKTETTSNTGNSDWFND